VTDASDSPPQAPQEVQLSTADDRWNQAYEEGQRTRLQRVQASARVWLGVLTTLFGLLGSVVLFKGGILVTGVTANGWFQVLLITLVGLVFITAMLAIVAGGAATWGGLDDIVPSDEEATGTAAQPQVTSAKGGETDDQRWIGQRFFDFFLLFALESKATRRKLRTAPRPPGRAAVAAGMPPGRVYKERSLYSANRRRALLHASRNLGVVMAGLIAVLAIVAVIAGTISPAPSEVIVVYHGRCTCIPVSEHTMYTGVTQVVPVSSC
jgi:hypothetical protein